MSPAPAAVSPLSDITATAASPFAAMGATNTPMMPSVDWATQAAYLESVGLGRQTAGEVTIGNAAREPPLASSKQTIRQKRQQEWETAKAGMWDTAVDTATFWASMGIAAALPYNIISPLSLFSKMKELAQPLKSGGPPSTGDYARDRALQEHYEAGGHVIDVAIFAASFDADIPQAFSLAEEFIPVSSLAEEFIPVSEGSQTLLPKLSLFDIQRSAVAAGERRAAIAVRDLGAIGATTSRPNFRRLLLSIIRDESHPLHGLLNAEGKLTPSTTKGMNELVWFENPSIIEAGHYESAKRLAGAPDRLVMMSAYENRLLSATVEHSSKGGEMLEAGKVLSIGGVPVDFRTAAALVEFGLLDAEVFANAPIVIY
jgi:hypothetical protein